MKHCLHTNTAAVGLTAAFTRALADKGISANVVAGVTVQWQAHTCHVT